MRYSSSHKEETRRKLIESSRAIAKEDGFASTSVDTLMASVGLTGGAFYNHFPSKQALFDALVGEEASNSADLLAIDDAPPDGDLAKRLRSYLSTHHALHPESGCALPTLGPEIARATPAARNAVEKSLKRIQKSLERTHRRPGCCLGGNGTMRWRPSARAHRGKRAHSPGDSQFQPAFPR